MSSYELHPERIAGNTLVLIANTLGSAAVYTDGRTGETVHRATEIVEQLAEYGVPAGALAYDRIERTDLTLRTYIMGMRAEDEASDYTIHCSRQARALQATVESLKPRHVVGFGASAAAQHYLGLLMTENIEPPDYAVLFDPPGMRTRTLLGMSVHWALHQLINSQRPDEAQNYNAVPKSERGSSPVSALEDMAVFRHIWTGTVALEGIMALAQGRIRKQSGTTTTLTIPEQTFTHSRKQAQEICQELNLCSPANGMFRARTAPKLYHSATDDPVVCGRLVANTLGFIEDDVALSYPPHPKQS